MLSILEEMADLFARHKLVPFFGAGISRAQLGVDAGSLANELAAEIGISPAPLLAEVSDLYAERKGEDSFINYMRRKLVIDAIEDDKVMAHILLISLNQNTLYTTNQDNVFELTAKKYGRSYKRVVTLDDLSEVEPGERHLIKFHGDLDVPDSLVFGAKSYRRRMSIESHPLDIRLRSDLLGKRLLFLGYSFKDENVVKLIEMTKQAFKENLPPSYLMAYEYDASMSRLEDEFGIRVVDPKRLFPDVSSSADAFERCLKELCDLTLNLQAKKGLDDLFTKNTINAKVVTKYEVNAVKRAIETEPFEIAVNAFRGEFDAARVPDHLQHETIESFRTLVDLADPKNRIQMNQLRAALFNFRLPPANALLVVSYLMAACNQMPSKDGYDDYGSLMCPAMPDHTMPVAAACAVAILGERKEPITDNFRHLAFHWFRSFDAVPEQMRDQVNAMINAAWVGGANVPRPISSSGNFFEAKGFHEIYNQIASQFPKTLKRPSE